MNTLVRFLPFLFLFLPFQFALSPQEGVDLSSVRLIGVILFFWWLIASLVRRKLFLPSLPPIFFATGFLLFALTSLLWGENPLFGLRKGVFLLSFFPLFFVFPSMFYEFPMLLSKSLRMFVGGAAGAAGVGLFFFFSQFLFGVEAVFSFLTQTILPFFLGETFAQSVAAHPSLLVNLSGSTVLRASGIFPDPHMFAFYLGMALPIAGSFFLEASSRKQRFITGGMAALILLAHLLSFSRGGYVGLLMGTLFFFLGSGVWKSFSQEKKVFIGMLVFFLGAVILLSPVGDRFFSSFSWEDGSNKERIRLFQEALGHISEHPLGGVGLGNYLLTVEPTASYRDPIYIHNLFLDITAEVGFIGLFFFLGFFLAPFCRMFLAWKQRRADQWLPLAVLSSLLVFLGHALFETPLFSVHVLPALLLILAVGVSYSYESSPKA